MKFLLIAYYFGNNSDVGAQRWNKNIKYIQKLGWEPVVYTFSKESEIEKQFEIISNNCIEPNKLYKFLFNKKVPSDILTSTKKKIGISYLYLFALIFLFQIPEFYLLFPQKKY